MVQSELEPIKESVVDKIRERWGKGERKGEREREKESGERCGREIGRVGR